ncbi:MAG: LytTR family DNA-binding domain-containing protein [Nitrospirota bacterium]
MTTSDKKTSGIPDMQILKGCLNIGLVLLSSDFQVTGMNEFARQILGPAMRESGKSVLQYHHRKSHLKIKGLLSESQAPPSNIPATMVIDVLNKVLMINVCKVTMEGHSSNPLYAMTFLDVTDQIGAETNPHTGMVELEKFPVINKGSLQFLDMQSIYFIQSDGNYCKVFTENQWYHLHFTLKNILKRYAGSKFYRIHKCFIVNTDHISRIEGRTIIFDRDTVPPVPIARRRIHELKNMLGVI